MPFFSSGGSSLPPGGTTGQLLRKASSTSGDADWSEPSIDAFGQLIIQPAVGAAGAVVAVRNVDGNDLLDVTPLGTAVISQSTDPGDVLLLLQLSADAAGFTGALLVTDSDSNYLVKIDGDGHVISAATNDPSGNLGSSQFALWLDPTPGATKLHITAHDSGGTPRSAVIDLT